MCIIEINIKYTFQENKMLIIEIFDEIKYILTIVFCCLKKRCVHFIEERTVIETPTTKRKKMVKVSFSNRISYD